MDSALELFPQLSPVLSLPTPFIDVEIFLAREVLRRMPSSPGLAQPGPWAILSDELGPPLSTLLRIPILP